MALSEALSKKKSGSCGSSAKCNSRQLCSLLLGHYLDTRMQRLRRRHPSGRDPSDAKAKRSHSSLRCLFIVVVLVIPRHHHDGTTVEALLPTSTTATFRGASQKTVLSPLFVATTTISKDHRHNHYPQRLHTRQPQQQHHRRTRTTTSSSASTTALSMVLTTPESIIEQASTVNLLDDLIDESVRTSPRRPIMMQFDPSSGWIWRRWKGTIFSETWTSCVKNIIYASLIYIIYKKYPGVKEHLNGFGTLWGQLLSVTTFTLTFFVNQSYALWRKCYELSRRLQGRLHDIGMNLATHATRKVPTTPEETSTYTAASRQILELMSRYIRLFDLLTYASFTRSHRPILTPRGMRRLVERGLMTAQERQVLVDAAIPATQRHSAILMWMMRLFVEGRESGHILGGDGFEQQTLEKFHIIRAQYGAIGDELQGRMPLAYAHVVQILVDLILWMYPIMAFSIGMSPLVAIAGTGLLTISYQGLFDLAKQFLDPYDNENYGKGEDPLSVDTLIAETNAGSVRWMYGFEEMPFSPDKVRDGELYDYRLPVRGYTVEELAQMEEEKLQREKEAEEQRIRDEQEQLRREEEETNTVVEESYEDAFEELVEIDGDSGEGVIGDSETGADAETPPVDAPPMHKVFTLADGTVVSFKEEPEIIQAPETTEKGRVFASRPAVPEVAASYLASLSRKSTVLLEPAMAVDSVTTSGYSTMESASDELREFPSFEDEQPEDGKFLLTQIVANVEAEKKEEIVAISSEWENGLAGSVDTMEVAISEETMGASPPKGVKEQLTGILSVGEVGTAEKEAPVAPSPTDPRAPMTPKPVEILVAKEVLSGRTEETVVDIVNGIPDDVGKPAAKKKVKESSTKPSDTSEMNDDSKMPATRMSIEDYNKQVEAIMETAKEELLETEAILNARPGYDPVGWDYDYDEKRVKGSVDGAVKEEEVTDLVDVTEEEDLAVLEMDEPDHEDGEDLEEEGHVVDEYEVDTNSESTLYESDIDDSSEYRL